MDTVAVIVSLVLAAACAASATGTLLKAPPIVANITAVGWPEDRLWVLGTLKLLGALGLVVGIWVPAIGIAAAVGIGLYFAGAVLFHLRAKNYEVAPAVVLLALAVASTVLQVAAA